MSQLERDAASDAAILEDAIEVLRLRFGALTAGDLISGLTGAAASIRARGGIIRPEAGRNRTLERQLDEPWDSQ
jgi:hypothetical protein